VNIRIKIDCRWLALKDSYWVITEKASELGATQKMVLGWQQNEEWKRVCKQLPFSEDPWNHDS